MRLSSMVGGQPGAEAIMKGSPYQQALERIRAEFVEMPCMRVTAQQLQRLSGVDGDVCRQVLADLVRAGFLRETPNGSYARGTYDSISVRTRR